MSMRLPCRLAIAYLQYLLLFDRQHAAGQEVEIYSFASITSRILYRTVKIQLAKTDPIRYHTVLRSPTPIKGENNGRRNDL